LPGTRKESLQLKMTSTGKVLTLNILTGIMLILLLSLLLILTAMADTGPVSAGEPEMDTTALDTAAIDATAQDTAVIDTAIINTAAIDTGEMSTAALDAAAADTGIDGEESSQTGQEGVFQTAQEEVSETGQDEVADTDQEGVPETGQERVPETDQEGVPETGQEEFSPTDQDEVPQTDQEGIPGPVEEDYFRGEVLEVEGYSTDRGLNQTAEVEITSGPHAGDVVTIDNYYEEHNRFLDIILEEGMHVILVGFEQDGEMEFHLQDMARDRGLLWAGLLLGAALLIVGKIKGLKTIITLVITGVIIIRVMLPLMLDGYSPIPVATLSALIIIAVILVIIGGFNAKTAAAILGTGSGVIAAGIMAYYVGNLANLTGLGTQEAQMLAVGQETLDITGLLYAGIIIGALGAITDVGMSVASSAFQIKKANPAIRFRELTAAAIEVGRDVMGTMANTLILAYVGGAIPFLLLLLQNQIHWLRIINMDFMASEILSGIAGTLGLVLAIPVTAVAAGLLLRN